MPRLEFVIRNLPQDRTIEARFEVQYDRGNGARTARNQPEDRVRIPASGSFHTVTGGTWQIWQHYINEPFFGGEATITYRIKDARNRITSTQTIRFRIGGRNPEPARARAFIESLPDAGPTGPLWFSYAIAKAETRDRNDQGTRYNHFWQFPNNRNSNYRQARTVHAGRPIWNNDGDGRPGGYGLYQITGSPTDSEANIPRTQIWNWQENVRAYFAIMRDPIKSELADRHATRSRSMNPTAFDEAPVSSNTVVYGTTNFTSNGAVWITAYNGWAGGISNRYLFTPSADIPIGQRLHNGNSYGENTRWYWNPRPQTSGATYLQLVQEELE
jgi:hypothetical protein